MNYGAVGMVIGHELTHGFDDEGRQFDADGNLKELVAEKRRGRISEAGGLLRTRNTASFSPVPGVELNGKLTLGENTADNGGMRLAYLRSHGRSRQENKPLTTKWMATPKAQQFFLGFAQVWCENQRPGRDASAARKPIRIRRAKFRVDGVVPNMPEFSEAFGCKAP